MDAIKEEDNCDWDDEPVKSGKEPTTGSYYVSDGNYFPVNAVVQGLPTREYRTVVDNRGLSFQPVVRESDKLLDIPLPEMKLIVHDMARFTESAEQYHRAQMIHKRGYLLYGAPGTGKTCLIARLAKKVIDDGGLVIHTGPRGFSAAVKAIKDGEGGRFVIFVMEEVDAWHIGEDILQVLDGAASPNNALFVATTNNEEDLPERIIDRPGRFDRVIKVNYPGAEARLAYTKELTRRLRVTVDDAVLKEILLMTEGKSIAHLKEMIIAVTMMGDTPKEAATRFGIKITKKDTTKELKNVFARIMGTPTLLGGAD